MFFDPYLTTTARFPQVIADNLACALAHKEDRRRRRRARDRQSLEAILQAVTANLAYAVVAGCEPPRLAVPLAKPKGRASRYDRHRRPGFRQLPSVLQQLEGAGLLTLTKGHKRGLASTIGPSPPLVATIRQFRKLGLSAFGSAAETIILSRNERDWATGERHGQEIDYANDHPAAADASRYRGEMARINDHLAAADLAYDGDDIDPNCRRLRRHFNLPPWEPEGTIRFDLGGRLFGGFWQDLSAELRPLLRLDGESIADLDYQSMFLRLAYVRAGEAPPPGDLYAGIPGFDDPRWRDGLKQVVNALLFRKGDMRRLPRGSRELLPPGTTAPAIQEAIRSRHRPIAPLLGSGVGFSLMFTESSILVAVLLRLIGEGITALPMHDGIMVAASRAEVAERAKGDVSAELLDGYRLPVARKG